MVAKCSRFNCLQLTIATVIVSTIVSTLPTKTIAQAPENFPQDCVAADWPVLKAEIDKRNNSVKTSLEEMISQVRTENIPEADINSQKQIEAIDSLLSCLNSPQFAANLSLQKNEAVQLLTNFKNNILNRAKAGLVNNDDGVFNNQDNFYSLKRNLLLGEEVAQMPIIGDTFIAAFEGAIETFTTNVSFQISQLPETLPPSLSPPTPDSTQAPDQDNQEVLGAIFLLLGGLILLVGIFLIYNDRFKNHRISKPKESATLTLPEQNETAISQEIFNLKSQINQINQKFNTIEINLSELKELISKNESNQNLSYQQEALNQEIFNLKSQLNDKFKIVGKALSKLIDTSIDTIDQPLQSSPKINHHLTIASPRTPSVSQSSKSKSTPESLQASSKTSQNLPTQLINTYNTNSDFLKSTAMGISETEGSFSARRSNWQMPMIFELNANQPRFWVLNDRFLVPFPQKITTHRLNTISGAFNYNDFSSGSPFELIQPAIVAKMNDGSDRWQLLSKGEIKFIPPPESFIES